MKSVLQHSALCFGLFAAGLSLIGCDQSPIQASTEEHHSLQDTNMQNPMPQQSQGNVFYIIRDVADFQMAANQHVNQLKQSQIQLQNALDNQNPNELATAAEQLQQRLYDFNQALNTLDLKSQEIENIKHNVIRTNQQVLQTPLFNGEYDLAKVDIKQLESQMGNIQNEMLKLAAMLLQEQDPTDHSNLNES